LNTDGCQFTVSAKHPFTPTTASSLSNARVVAGSSRFTAPRLTAFTRSGDNAPASTFNPSVRACARGQARPNTAICGTGYGLMQPKCAAPERFTAKSVEPKDFATIVNKLGGMIANCGIVTLQSLITLVAIRPEHASQKHDGGERHASTSHRLSHGVLRLRLPQSVRLNEQRR
jgi:hypothetical protein